MADILDDEGKKRMSTGKIFMRNGLSQIVIGLPIRREELQEIFKVMHVPEPRLLLTNHGVDHLAITMEHEDLNAIVNSVKKEDIQRFQENLTSLQITTRETMRNTKGVMAFIGTLFTQNKMSIIAAEFGEKDIVLIFDKETGPRAFYLLNNTMEKLKNPTII